MIFLNKDKYSAITSSSILNLPHFPFLISVPNFSLPSLLSVSLSQAVFQTFPSFPSFSRIHYFSVSFSFCLSFTLTLFFLQSHPFSFFSNFTYSSSLFSHFLPLPPSPFPPPSPFISLSFFLHPSLSLYSLSFSLPSSTSSSTFFQSLSSCLYPPLLPPLSVFFSLVSYLFLSLSTLV